MEQPNKSRGFKSQKHSVDGDTNVTVTDAEDLVLAKLGYKNEFKCAGEPGKR